MRKLHSLPREIIQKGVVLSVFHRAAVADKFILREEIRKQMESDEKERPRILYVEDDPRSRLVIKKLLENAGCIVYEAADGKQGVEKAAALKPDAILMDILLPVMDGLEATRRIRETKEISKTPIIVLTAKAMAGDREQILAAGCDEYIAKPVNLPLLLRLLSKVLGRELITTPQNESGPKTVLVVDDTPKNVMILEKVLRSKGFNVLTAPDGRIALAVLREKRVDLIISDIVMPEMDGYSLCYEVMKTYPLTRFIFYSSHYSSTNEVDFGLRLGADSYMVRPLKIEKLLDTVGTVLQKEKVKHTMNWEEFQEMHTKLLTSKITEVAPVREVFDSKAGVTLQVGRSYLIKERTPQESYTLFLDQLSQGFTGLCLTRTNPKFVMQKYDLGKTPFIWLSTTKSKEFTSTIDLTEISLSIKNFILKAERGVILLDGFEFLVSKVGFHTMLEFLQVVNEFISNYNCIFLVSVDPETLAQRELSLLEREMVVFP